jgi:hypothetical protein
MVFDPFSGCGTVALTAAQHGLSAAGIEVNPFLAFVSQTKLATCNTQKLLASSEKVLAAVLKPRPAKSPLEGYSTFSQSGERSKWLFNSEVLRAFETGWHATATAGPRQRRFLRLALVKAAMDSCNATADGKCLRYRKNWKECAFDRFSVGESFERYASNIAEDIDEVRLSGSGIVYSGDARSLITSMRRRFRLCVTSPPYLNSFDYSDVYRPELFLANFVKNTAELRRIRLRTIRSHVQVRWEPPTKSDFGEIYTRTAKDLREVQANLWDSHIPLMVQAYFEDMSLILRNLYRLAAKDAQLWLVVSTSAYGGVEIPVDMILAEVAVRSGWYLKEIGIVRHMRHSGHHWMRLPDKERAEAKLREAVVVLTRIPV